MSYYNTKTHTCYYVSYNIYLVIQSSRASKNTNRLLTTPPAAGAVTWYAISVQASITCRTYKYNIYL